MALDWIDNGVDDPGVYKGKIDETANLLRQPPVSSTTAAGAAGVDYEVVDWAPLTFELNVIYRFKAHIANAGACHVDKGGSPVNIKTLGGSDPAAGVLQAGGVYDLLWDGTNLVIVNGLINVLVNPTINGATISNPSISNPSISNPSINPAGTGLHATFGDSSLTDHYLRFRNNSGNSIDIGMSGGISASGGCLIWCGLLKSFGIAVNASGTDFETAVNADLAFEVTTAGTVKAGGNEVATRQSQIVSLAGSNHYTAGSLKVVRVGDIVTVTGQTDLTHSNASLASSAVGAIPAWARPEETVTAVYLLAQSARLYQVSIEPDGQIFTNYLDWAGAASSATTAFKPTITYCV